MNHILKMTPRNRFKVLILFLSMVVAQAAHGQQPDSAVSGDSSQAKAVASPTTKVEPPLSDSAKKAIAANVALGRELFQGGTALINGGPSCISCHNVKAEGIAPGGLLAKDLTHVFGRLGDAGLPPILSSTPFPAMASAYRNKPLEKQEVAALTAFFKDVEATAPPAEPAPDHTILLAGGSIGIVVWFGLIGLIWYNRKKNSVKKAIYDRQQH